MTEAERRSLLVRMSSNEDDEHQRVLPTTTESGNDGKLLLTPTAALDHIQSRSLYLHVLIACCSFAWAVNGAVCLTASFYDQKPPNSTFVTISQEFDLTGDRKYLSDATTSAFMLGNLIGGLSMSLLSDRFGRRMVLHVNTLCISFTTFLLPFASNVWMFSLGRLLQGLFYTGLGQNAWVLAMECCPGKLRSASALLFGVQWVVGLLIIVPFALVSNSWKSFLLLTAIVPACFTIVTVIMVPESLHFVASHGKDRELKKWSKKMAPGYGIKTIQADHKERVSFSAYMKRDKSFLWPFLFLSGIWMSDSFIYFGLSIYSTSLAGNMYVNYILICIIELPAYILTHGLLEGLSRRGVMFVTHLIAMIAFLALTLIPSGANWLQVSCWVIAKLCVSISYMTIYVAGVEIFPTMIRSTAMGYGSVLSRISSVFAPYIRSLDHYHHLLVPVVLVVVTLLGAIFSLLLPESKGANLDGDEAQAINEDDDDVRLEMRKSPKRETKNS